jgi:L-ascorbate metabolism protein UlaG (beta-lactamase superfamily)
MKVTRYAQSTITLESNGHRLVIDPGIYNFEPDRVTREHFAEAQTLIVTHKHADHFDPDAVRVIGSSGAAKIFTTSDVHHELLAQSINSAVLRVGDRVQSGPFSLEAIRADHIVRDEVLEIFGLRIECGGKTVYHASDTTYFEPTVFDPDIAFLPINNRGVAMNFDDAKRFAVESRVKLAVPVHYDSPKDQHINPHEWLELLAGTSVTGLVMAFQETLGI